MGRVRNLRLPDGMEMDVDRYLAENKIKFTDLAISGITGIIYGENTKGGGKKEDCITLPGCPSSTGVEQLPDEASEVPKTVEHVKDLISKAVEKKVSEGVYFRPMTKEGQLYNKGKGK